VGRRFSQTQRSTNRRDALSLGRHDGQPSKFRTRDFTPQLLCAFVKGSSLFKWPKSGMVTRSARERCPADGEWRGGGRGGTSGDLRGAGSGSRRVRGFLNRRGRRRWDGRDARDGLGFDWCGRLVGGLRGGRCHPGCGGGLGNWFWRGDRRGRCRGRRHWLARWR